MLYLLECQTGYKADRRKVQIPCVIFSWILYREFYKLNQKFMLIVILQFQTEASLSIYFLMLYLSIWFLEKWRNPSLFFFYL